MLTSHALIVTVAVESARTSDADRLLRAAEAELCHRYPEYDCPVFPAEAVEVPGAAFFVARLDTEAVGCLALRPHVESPDVAELKRLWVHPARRGYGIAKTLLTFAEAWAVGAGYTSLILETGIGQPEAIALYARVGYDCIPCWGEYAGDEHSVCYRKSLQHS